MSSTVSPPVTMDEALALLNAALRYLDETDFSRLPAEEQARLLPGSEDLGPLTAATRASILGAAAARPAGGRHRVPAPPAPPRG